MERVTKMKLVMSFQENDKNLINELKKQFGEEIVFERNKGFDGLEILITVAIPIAELTIHIIEFIISNFCNRERSEDCNNKRLLISPDGNIDMSGYSEEEARQIIKCYFESQNDNRE